MVMTSTITGRSSLLDVITMWGSTGAARWGNYPMPPSSIAIINLSRTPLYTCIVYRYRSVVTVTQYGCDVIVY